MKKNLASAFALVFTLAVAVTIAQAADTGLSNRGKNLIKFAASYGIFEVQLGAIARERGESQDVKDYGSLMVTDHEKTSAELDQIAKKNNVTLPDQMDPDDKKTIDRLLKLTGADFDSEYAKDMVKVHKKYAAVFRKAIPKLKDPDLRSFALKTDQVIEGHLKHAEYLASKFWPERSW